MNLANRITMLRIVLSFIIIGILMVPFDAMGIQFPKLFVGEAMVIEIKYIVAGILFIIASITDFLDGYIARSRNMVTDFGKTIDAIADKILVNSVLIILASTGFIHPIIPVVIIIRDTFVNSFKMLASNNGEVVAAISMGKIKSIFLMVGIALTLFYNLPFELWNLRISDFILLIAMVLSIISGLQYYTLNKKYFKVNSDNE